MLRKTTIFLRELCPEHSSRECAAIIHQFWKSGGPSYWKEVDFTDAPIAHYAFNPRRGKKHYMKYLAKLDDVPPKKYMSSNLLNGGERKRRKKK